MRTTTSSIDYIAPGKPSQNVFMEYLNRSYRNEVLDTWLFRNLSRSRGITLAWMLENNEEPDHDALGGTTPAEAPNARISTVKLSA